MKNEFNKYGRKISAQEMNSAISAIYPKGNTRISHAAQERFREDETSIMIDHKLGVDYPDHKRQIIHDARERATRRFTRSPSTLFKAVCALFPSRHTRPGGFDNSLLSLGHRIMAEEFTREPAIATDDIIAFLGDEFAPYVHKLRRPAR